MFKKYVKVSQLPCTEPFVAVVESGEDLARAFPFFTQFKGIQFRSSVELDIPEEINYLSIVIEKKEHLTKVLSLKQKDRFIELIIPVEFVLDNYFLLNQLQGIRRVVFQCSTPVDTQQLFAECIARNIFPLTKGIPLCYGQPEHCYEFYQNTVRTNNECVFGKHCQHSDSFPPQNTEIKHLHDALQFLQNENSLTRL